MRKIYSLVLMAAMLLVGTNVQAQNVAKIGNTEYATIEAAFNAATNGQIIQLIGAATEITQTKCIEMYAAQKCGRTAAVGARHLTLDMNGHNLKLSSTATNNEYPWNFGIWQGSLHITGTGSVINAIPADTNYKYNNMEVIVCKLFGSNDISDTDFTHLTIDENVDLIATTGKSGITIDQVGNTPKNESTPLGYDAPHVAFGVVVDVYGYVKGEKYGIQISGNINPTSTGTPVANASGLNTTAKDNSWNNLPHVNIYSTAEVVANATAKEATGVYAAGYGFWLIEGYVHGSTGVSIKSGDVDINNATVASDNPDYVEDKGNTGKKSGISQGGSAITIQSQSGYAGGQDVTISGDSKITGNGGYAVDEFIKDSNGSTDGDSKVSSVTIEGGTLEGNDDKGSIVITQATVENEVVIIVGGNYNGNVTITNEEGQATQAEDQLFDLLPEGEYHITTVVVDGKTTNVISEGTVTTSPTLSSNMDVDWSGSSETLTSDLTLGNLEMNQTFAQTITITNGSTLTVEKLIMGEHAQIIVEAGAKLILSGAQGAVAQKTSNIVLKGEEGNMSQLLFNPAVTSNKHPNATIEFEVNSYTTSATDYRKQRFGVPTHTAVKSITATKNSQNIQVGLQKYDVDGWLTLGYINVLGQSVNLAKLNEPFAYYQLQCNTPEPGTIITMTGELVGNQNYEFTTVAEGWSTYANSFNANMKLSTMLSLFDNLENANAAIYFSKQMDNTAKDYTWTQYNKTTALFDGLPEWLEPMQAFVIQNAGVSYSATLNYTTMVWNPAMNISNSVAPRCTQALNSKLALNLVDAQSTDCDAVYMIEGSQFSNDLDNGYDAEKYINNNANLFVTNDGLFATCATDDLNNQYLGFSCAAGGIYTINFNQVTAENLVLVDLNSNVVTPIVDGGFYTFTADENESNDYRFQIRRVPAVVTDIENIEETTTTSTGIYTITGQYVGNMNIWNTLPSGLYIVDGEKKIK